MVLTHGQGRAIQISVMKRCGFERSVIPTSTQSSSRSLATRHILTASPPLPDRDGREPIG